MLISLNCLYAITQILSKELLVLLWNLSRLHRVLEKNKVSTSLKIRGFYYVADTPDFPPKSLDKTHFLYCAIARKKSNKHPLKINLKQTFFNIKIMTATTQQTEPLNLNTVSYKEFKHLSEKKFNEIPLYYFFNTEQKIVVLKKLKIKENELKDKVFMFQGGIILKTQSHKIDEFYNWLCECEKTIYQREDYLYQLFYYELFNHEVQITCDYDSFLEQIGIELDTKLKIKAFEKAKKDHWKYCVKHDCF